MSESHPSWESMLCPAKLRVDESGGDKPEKTPKPPGIAELDDMRSPYLQDYDRIIYSSAFRRLQDKAQVFPLEKHDFVRTRLTHSLEVSSLGRSIGYHVGLKLFNEDVAKAADVGSIVAAAGLIHDLGNPPFGHFGEDIIQQWFLEYFDIHAKADGSNVARNTVQNGCEDGSKDDSKAGDSKNARNRIETSLKDLSNIQKDDFRKFEGNAQGLRILTRLQVLKDEFGLNLTASTLATFMKYVSSSADVNGKGERASHKKVGHFQSEKDRFTSLNEKFGGYLGTCRHPFAFMLEAADDIAYAASDVEDAIRKGVVSWEQLLSAFENDSFDSDKDIHWTQDDKKQAREYLLTVRNSLDSKFKFFRDVKKYAEPQFAAVQMFRIEAQGLLLQACIRVFLENQAKILAGNFNKPLLDAVDPTSIGLYKLLKNELGVKHIYPSKQILRMEVVGHRVICELLDVFVPAILSINFDEPVKAKAFEGKLYHLISPNFRYIFEQSERKTYHKLQLVTDFISGMTDSYALDVYRQISGASLVD